MCLLRSRFAHMPRDVFRLVQIVPERGVCLEEYTAYKALGRIALREGGKTLAVGIVTRILEQK